MVQRYELCGEKDETRDHLFFACPFSYTVQEGLARHLVENHINPNWHCTVNRLHRMGGKGVDSILAKLLFQTTVWRERNTRRHQQNMTSTEQMQRLIDKAVRNRICSLMYKPDHKFVGLLRRWFQVTLQRQFSVNSACTTPQIYFFYNI